MNSERQPRHDSLFSRKLKSAAGILMMALLVSCSTTQRPSDQEYMDASNSLQDPNLRSATIVVQTSVFNSENTTWTAHGQLIAPSGQLHLIVPQHFVEQNADGIFTILIDGNWFSLKPGKWEKLNSSLGGRDGVEDSNLTNTLSVDDYALLSQAISDGKYSPLKVKPLFDVQINDKFAVSVPGSDTPLILTYHGFDTVTNMAILDIDQRSGSNSNQLCAGSSGEALVAINKDGTISNETIGYVSFLETPPVWNISDCTNTQILGGVIPGIGVLESSSITPTP